METQWVGVPVCRAAATLSGVELSTGAAGMSAFSCARAHTFSVHTHGPKAELLLGKVCDTGASLLPVAGLGRLPPPQGGALDFIGNFMYF